MSNHSTKGNNNPRRRPRHEQPASYAPAQQRAQSSQPLIDNLPALRTTKPNAAQAMQLLAPKQLERMPLKAHKQQAGEIKLFIIDTNVLLHDPTCLYRFEEHDVFLPMIVLEELDNHKKGQTEVARNGRQVSRVLDALLKGADERLDLGINLAQHNSAASGKLFVQTEQLSANLPDSLAGGKADNQILTVCAALKIKHLKRPVILVSKDINMRIKARTLGLQTEDYFNDQVLEDSDLLYSGSYELPTEFWQRNSKGQKQYDKNKAPGQYEITGPDVASLCANCLLYQQPDFQARVKSVTGNTAVVENCRDYTQTKHAVWGVIARNREQNYALNLLLDPDIDFVTLLGQAGTGKTLLTLAAALHLCLDKQQFTEIIITRVTVPVGEDIGFLPGTEEEKMTPWMGALEDNLEVLTQSSGGHHHDGGSWGRAAGIDLVRSRIKIKSLNFMRGRTFLNKFVIIDEAQNLTPKQMKTLITRAGPGTKVVCLGNIAQIDTPYLSEGSSGMTYVVDRFKGWPHHGHITLQRGERSRLADFAASTL